MDLGTKSINGHNSRHHRVAMLFSAIAGYDLTEYYILDGQPVCTKTSSRIKELLSNPSFKNGTAAQREATLFTYLSDDVFSECTRILNDGDTVKMLNDMKTLDEQAYRMAFSDIDQAIIRGQIPSGREHYRIQGYKEKRLEDPRFIKVMADLKNFNEQIYRIASPDIDQAITKGLIKSGLEHYKMQGFRENRLDYPLYVSGIKVDLKNFDEQMYRIAFQDIDQALIRGELRSGLAHYVSQGVTERRLDDGRYIKAQNDLKTFDEQLYRMAFQDIDQALIKGLLRSGFEHYRDYGFREKRLEDARFIKALSDLKNFNEQAYRSAFPDISQAIATGLLKSGLEHYKIQGFREYRLDDPRYVSALKLGR